MDEAKKREIAAFRYGLISGVINRLTPLETGEVTAYFKEVSEKTIQIPESNRKSVSIRTLERYKALYEKHGLDGLLPKGMSKRGTRVVEQSVLETAANLRKDRPERSVEQIIFTLEKDNIVESGKLSASTLSRYLRSNGLSRKQLVKSKNNSDTYKRFEAAAPKYVAIRF
jgi:transposase